MKLPVRPVGALFLFAGLVACEVPSGIPRWETTWITPGETMTVSVAELLPADLAITPDGSAFELAFDPVNVSWTLGDFCGACPPVTATAPKPAFTADVATTMTLPADVISIDVAGGGIVVRLTNGFDFDPIRPGVSADSGSITVRLRSGAALVGSLVFDGRQRAFPPGGSMTDTLNFLPSTITGDLDVELTIVSPAGDVTTMNPNDQFSVALSSDGVLVSEATVGVTSQSISGAETELDLSDVDLDRINEGTIFLEIVNPFSVTGNLTMIVDPEGPAGPFTKPVTLAPGTTERQVTFTESEIEQMVGEINTLSFGGVVSATGGQLTVRPDMVISVTTRLRVTVEVGGDPEDDSGF